MNTANHIDHLLQDLLDGELDDRTAARVKEHLACCETCRISWESLCGLVADVRSLPKAVNPPRDLWDEIEARLADLPVAAARVDDSVPAARVDESASATGVDESASAAGVDDSVRKASVKRRDVGRRRQAREREDAPASARRPRRGIHARVGLAVAVLIATGVAVWIVTRGGNSGWDVESLDGTPIVARQMMGEGALLRPGEWLETDNSSRARLRVGTIGEVDVEPNTRVQLRRTRLTDHRIALAEGRIDARIWAPPRLFFVETPSATAIDLGCAYTLDVDSNGKSVLHVTSGYVELEKDGKSSVVPAGAMCYAYPDFGPGTVFSASASPALQSALERYDFEGGRDEDLSIVLAEAGPDDAMTLWDLVVHTDGARRDRIYSRLVEIVRPPSGVTREGVLDGDEDMFVMWRLHLGLDAMSWWGYLREKMSFPE